MISGMSSSLKYPTAGELEHDIIERMFLEILDQTYMFPNWEMFDSTIVEMFVHQKQIMLNYTMEW